MGGPTTTSPMLDSALALAAAGFRVIPLYELNEDGSCGCPDGGECKSPGKHPRLPAWQRRATGDSDEIRRYWGARPRSNVGMLTGADACSGGCIVLDVDPHNGGDYSIDELVEKYGPLPATPLQLTGGGGQHYVFRHPGFYVKSDSLGAVLGPGLDIKGDGGQIVVEPSRHKSGQCYAWELSAHILEVPLAPVPEWLEAILRNRPQEQKPPVGEIIPEGNRSTALARMAGAMRRPGMSEDEIVAALLVANKRRCQPPLSDAEVRRIAHSVAKYSPEPETFSAPVRGSGSKEKPGKDDGEQKPLEYFTAAALWTEHLPPLVSVVDGLIVEGLNMLVGPGKVGKSWMALQIGVDVARGRPVMGRFDTKPCVVLYLALEDGKRRLQNRLDILRQKDSTLDPNTLTNLVLNTAFRQLGQGCVQAVEDFLAATPDCRLIIIDVFQKIRGRGDRNRNAYEQDYDTLTPLQQLALARHVALVMVHHTNKTQADDVFDSVSGSTGIMACADTTLLLRRPRAEPVGTLHVTGRDVEERKLQVRFDDPVWVCDGDADQLERTALEQSIIDALLGNDNVPMSPTSVANAVGKTRGHVQNVLGRLRQKGMVVSEQGGSGRYLVSDSHLFSIKREA